MKTINNDPTYFDIEWAQEILNEFSIWNIEIKDYAKSLEILIRYERYCVNNDLERPDRLYQVIKCLAYATKTDVSWMSMYIDRIQAKTNKIL